MRDTFPAVNVKYEKHFVRDGRVFTFAGISAYSVIDWLRYAFRHAVTAGHRTV